MKLSVLLAAMLLALPGAAGADEGDGGVDSATNATVAAPGYDPTNPDCKCLGPKKVDRPLDNEAYDRQVVNWIVNPDATGAPPALPESTR